jgi:hypothetical protein
MPQDFNPYHRYLEFMSPLSNHRAGELVEFLSGRANGRVVDFGCGWAAFLTRTLTANEHILGVGVDLDDRYFEHATKIAEERAVAERFTLIAGDARTIRLDELQGAICIGASQIWGPPVDARQPLDYRAALTALRTAVRHRAPVVYGEAIWSAKPTQAAINALSGREDEYAFLPELLEIVTASGFAIVQTHEASLDEWDHFESGYVARYADWLVTHPVNHSDAPEVLSMARSQRDAYFGGYRGILGMAYLALVAV